MKKLLYVIAAFATGMMATSCLGDGVEDKYKDWNEANQKWFNEQSLRIGSDGKAYYEVVTASWDPSARILMHWYNDREKTKDNLKPLYTSMVDVVYKGSLYDGTPFDSSYLSTTPRKGVARFNIGQSGTSNGVIEGWAIALQNMHVGDSCHVIINYQQGYGLANFGYDISSSANVIKPYSVLQFDMKLDDIYKYEAAH